MKKNILAICLLCFCILTRAQSTKVAIMDFYIESSFNVDGTNSSDSTDFIVRFKIFNCDSAVKAHVYFGTQKDLADVQYFEAAFIKENGKYFTFFNGLKKEIELYSATVALRMSKQKFNSFTNASLFVETISGINTPRLYLMK